MYRSVGRQLNEYIFFMALLAIKCLWKCQLNDGIQWQLVLLHIHCKQTLDSNFMCEIMKTEKEKQTRKRYEPSFVIHYMTSFAQTSLQAYKQNFPCFCFATDRKQICREIAAEKRNSAVMSDVAMEWIEAGKCVGFRVDIHIFATILDGHQLCFEPCLGFAVHLHNTTINCTACIFTYFSIFKHLTIQYEPFYVFSMNKVDFRFSQFRWNRELYDDVYPLTHWIRHIKCQNGHKLKWNWKWTEISKYAIISFIRNDFVVYWKVMTIILLWWIVCVWCSYVDCLILHQIR